MSSHAKTMRCRASRRVKTLAPTKIEQTRRDGSRHGPRGAPRRRVWPQSDPLKIPKNRLRALENHDQKISLRDHHHLGAGGGPGGASASRPSSRARRWCRRAASIWPSLAREGVDRIRWDLHLGRAAPRFCTRVVLWQATLAGSSSDRCGGCGGGGGSVGDDSEVL